MGYIFLIAVILAVSIGASQKGCGIKCFSFSCRFNRSGKCGRQEITVYDNTVTGLCLNHTESMKDRVIEPIMKSSLFGSHKHKTCVSVKSFNKTQEAILDDKLLKNSSVFAKWLRKQLTLKEE